MSNKNLDPDQLIACEICLKEIPLSEAKNDQNEDYVRHFCGLECYSTWQEKADKSETEEA